MIAVLDYGIGNLRSAEKALQHVGADARLVDDPDDAAEADGHRAARGRCLRAVRRRPARRAAWRRGHRRGDPGHPLPRHLRRVPTALRGLRGEPRRPRARCPARAPSGACPTGSSTRRCSGTPSTSDRLGRCWPACPTRRGSTSSTPMPPSDRSTPRLDVRLRRTGGGRRRTGPGVGHPVPPREVGVGRSRHPGQLRGRRRPAPADAVMDLYPAIDIRDGGAVRLTQGDFDRQSDYGDPVALAARFAAAGAPWLHVVDLDAARSGVPVNRATVLAIAAAVDVPSRPAVACAARATSPNSSMAGWPGWSWARRPSTIRLWCVGPPRPSPVGWPSASTTDDRRRAGRGGRPRAGRRARGARSVTCSPSWPVPGWPPSSSPPSSATARCSGPDLDGLSRRAGARPTCRSSPRVAWHRWPTSRRWPALEVDGGRRRRRDDWLGAITGKALVDGRMTVEEGWRRAHGPGDPLSRRR